MYLKEEKFALWVDFIEKDFITTTMRKMIQEGTINGATSNPAIFKNAFLTSPAYKEVIEANRGKKSAKEIYEMLAVADIKQAAIELRSLYDANDDGYVSIEVDPTLADDTQATIEEGRRLFATIGEPNVMIKVPATTAGYEAMEVLVSEGISVNATLIFSFTEALSCASAFKKGQAKTDKKVDTVISIFVSRVDRKIDAKLPKELQAKAGIVNAAYIYNQIEKMGIKNNRVLFASTGVKGDTLEPSYYVDNLLAQNSVNTAPLETIKAFVKKGVKTLALPLDQASMEMYFQNLVQAQITLDEVLVELKREGLQQFEEAFAEIMDTLKSDLTHQT